MNGDEWKIGDVLFLSGDGCSPTLFIAEHLPGSFKHISRGCYSPDQTNTRKATIEDADWRIEVQIRAVNREMERLQRLFELRDKIRSAEERAGKTLSQWIRETLDERAMAGTKKTAKGKHREGP